MPHFRRIRPAVGRRSQGVIRLQLHHRPHRQAQGRRHPLRQGKLGQQLRGNASSGLVVSKEFVAKGMDDAVKSHADIGNARLSQQQQQGLRQAAHRRHFPPVRSLQRGQGKVGAEQFVSAVNQVEGHG